MDFRRRYRSLLHIMIIKKLIKSDKLIPIIPEDSFNVILMWSNNGRKPIEEYRTHALSDDCITDNIITIILQEFNIKLLLPASLNSKTPIITKKFYKTFINNNVQYISEDFLADV